MDNHYHNRYKVNLEDVILNEMEIESDIGVTWQVVTKTPKTKPRRFCNQFALKAKTIA